MATIEATFVQGNTGPDIVSQLTDEATGLPINLAGASVKFQMRRPDDTKFTIDAAAEITSAGIGMVAYHWLPNQLSVPGEYDCQWETTFVDGKVITNAHPNRILVRRR